LDVILQQNYLSLKNHIYQPKAVISMGSPISNIIAEIFLQHMESTLMNQLFDTKNIAFYTRYVNDILLIYNSQHITPETMHNYINRIHPNLNFNPTYENNNSINFLGLLVIRNQFSLEIDICRKPTRQTPPSTSYPTTRPNTKLQPTAIITTECCHSH